MRRKLSSWPPTPRAGKATTPVDTTSRQREKTFGGRSTSDARAKTNRDREIFLRFTSMMNRGRSSE